MSKAAWRSERQAFWAGLALVLAVFVSLVMLDRPLVRGDGLAYYMWLGPVTTRFTFDLTSAVEQFAGVNEYQVFRVPGGGYGSAFSFGPAILLAPWYRLALLLPEARNVNLAHYVQYQGDGFIRSFFVLLGSNTYTVLAVLLSYKVALSLVRAPWTAAAAAFTLLWGTPLIYYATIEPYMAHALGTFLLALALYLYTRPRPRWLLLGVVLSVAVVVRWQLALLLIPIGIHLLWRRRWRESVRLGVGTLSLAWLVPLSWQQMFGSFLVVPAAIQNQSPFLGLPVHALDVLISAKAGLFLWSPLTVLALAGLLLLWRKHTRLAAVSLAAFVLQVLINGGVQDWAAGWSYGMRRLTELYPFFVVGLAYLLGVRGLARWPLWAAAAALFVLSGVIFFAHITYANAVAGHGAPFPQEVAYWLGRRDALWVTLDVVKGHYGPLAWRQPGP